MKIFRKFSFILVLILFTFPLVNALDFSVSCPSQVDVGRSFDCTVAMSNPGSVGLQGLSFTVDTGGATVSSVSFDSSLTDISTGNTYGFFSIGEGIVDTNPFATIKLMPTGTNTISLQLIGIKGSLNGGTLVDNLNFPRITIDLPGQNFAGNTAEEEGFFKAIIRFFRNLRNSLLN